MVERNRRREDEENIVPMSGDILSSEDFDAVIFDLDGVITDTATLHFRAWKEVFDNFLRANEGRGFEPFTKEDYFDYVDGKPRFEGVQSFLASRGVTLPRGKERNVGEQRLTETESLLSLATKKNERFLQFLESGQVELFEDAVDLLGQLIRKGIRTALVSSSRNARRVLQILDLEAYFDECVDGKALEEMALHGKPAPDMFVEAVTRLGVEPSRAAVIEDARSGVQAGRAGGFGLVIGVANNQEQQQALLDHGADLAVASLSSLLTMH